MGKYFTLDVDENDPRKHDFKDKDGNAHTVPDFDKMLNQGKLTIVGLICKGDLPSVKRKKRVAQTCVIVYVGGTAYKVCR